MQIGIDQDTKVRLFGDAIPNEWNGIPLKVIDLNVDQEVQWQSLPSDRSGATFDGVTFTAIPVVQPPTPTLASITGARVGTVTISGTNTSVGVSFPKQLSDTDYKVFPTVSGFTGPLPPVGARVVNVNGNTKTTTGFSLVLAAAPGVGSSVIVDFLVVKLSPQA